MYFSNRNILWLALLFLLVGSQAAAQGDTPTNVVWYISPDGSSDISTCGRTMENPCVSITVILNESPLFPDENDNTCRTSPGDNDGRTSTTLYLMNGMHHIPNVCVRNWTNLSVIGLGDNVIVTGPRPGALRGVFNLIDCKNLTIHNLNYQASFEGTASMNVLHSIDVTLSSVSVAVTRSNSQGVLLEQCYGNIVITDAIFFSSPEILNTDVNLQGLSVSFGCENTSSTSSNGERCYNPQPASLQIRNATFQHFQNKDPITIKSDSYGNTRLRANALRIRFRRGAINNEVMLQDLKVMENFNPSASSVIVLYDTGSSNNSVRIVGSTFMNNHVRYGGGVAAYFYNGVNSNLEVEGSTFVDNKATFEGGGIFVALLNSSENEVRMTQNTLSRNSALIGAAMHLFNSPSFFTQRGLFDPLFASSLTNVYINDCSFTANIASLKEGVVDALRVNLIISGETSFMNNIGSSIYLRASAVHFHGNVTFMGNKAETGAAINMRQGSRVDLSEATSALFAHNKATFAGGAIYADSASTTQLSNEYNHTLAQSTNLVSCFIQFGNELSPFQGERRINFRGNVAIYEGHHIHAFSLRGCVIANFVPPPTASFFRIPVDDTVGFDEATPLLDSTSTGANYLYFYGASTRCLKTVANTTFLLPNCSHELLNQTFSKNGDIQCALDALVNSVNGEFMTDFRLSTALPPTLERLITPWAGLDSSWTRPPGDTRLNCPETNPGSLYLSPAPGEQFDLTIQLGDQLNNIVSDTIYMEVRPVDYEPDSDQPPGVLIQLNGLQYSYRDRVYFTPNRALSGLALVGAPGTVGKLRIVADSQIMGESVELLIPFKLAQCPDGYYDPPKASSVDEVNAQINSTFLMTQRIPTDQPLACQCFSSPNQASVKFSNDITAWPHRCISGYTVELNSIFWAGRIPTKDSGPNPAKFPPPICCPAVNATPVEDNLTQFFQFLRQDEGNNTSQGTLDPVDVVPYDGGVVPGGGAPVLCFNHSIPELIDYKSQGNFSIEFCTRGYCRGNLRSNWFVADVDYPCVGNRMGPLCGQCKKGHAVTMYSTTCRNCTGQAYHLYLALGLTIFGGLILVVFAVALNFGASPTLDSLLFFIQATMIILSGRADYDIFKWLSFFNPDFTVNLCITPHLDGFTRLALQYVTPFYILLLLTVVLILSCIKGFARYLGKHSFLHALWLLVLISYLNIANTTFELLHCQQIGPEGAERSIVLVHDASVMCFKDAHLAFAIIAIVLATFFVLPFPVFLVVFMHVPKYKPITDVYCSPYKDHLRWWVLISLFRRLLLVLVGVFIQNFVSRHFGLLVAVAVILIVYVMSWPYNNKIDNSFGLLVTWMLLMVTIITSPDLYLLVDPYRVVSSLFVVLTIVIGFVLLIAETIVKLSMKKTLEEFSSQRLKPLANNFKKNFSDKLSNLRIRRDSDGAAAELVESTQSSIVPRNATIDATGYREPLLDSLYSGPSASINGDSLTNSRKPVKAKRTLFGRKSNDRPLLEEDEVWRRRAAPTSTVVYADRTTGDSGFATTYTDGSTGNAYEEDQNTL